MKPPREGNPPREGLGERISRLRRKRDWSQRELARRTGTRGSQISKYERGDYEPRLEVLSRIAEALETTTDFLITGSEGLGDPRLRSLLPQMEALPRQLRDGLVQFLEGLLRSHQAIELGRGTRSQPKMRRSRVSTARD